MARPLRIEYPGALYHITSRGNNKQAIFVDDTDRAMFLQILSNSLKIYNWQCYSYCLMGNHFHILVETVDPTLSAGMHYVNGVYTQQFNKKYKTVGHIFQGRFQAYLIEKENYLLEVARYNVLNPVRAGLVEHPSEWAWSSFCATAGLINSPTFLSKDAILKHFSTDRFQAQRAYISFVEERIEYGSLFDQVKHASILGSPQFVDFVWNQAPNVSRIQDVTNEQRMIGRLSLAEIFSDVGVCSKQNRDDAICLARQLYGYPNAEIARFLNMSASTISDIVNSKNRRSKA